MRPVAASKVSETTTRHVFTVDVEEWFHVSALEPHAPRADWDVLPSRVEQPTLQLLDMLAEANSTGTFFVLGWVAERRPALVRRIADAGHEIASHGWWHRRVPRCSPDEFRADVRRSRELLSDIIGKAVVGYRAPSFSIAPGYEWAFDVLLEEGYLYDSSVFPIRRSRGYGYPGAPTDPYMIERPSGRLLELPLTPLDVGGWRIPACGGAYFRHLPYALARLTLRQRMAQSKRGVFYTHPWELDEAQPRLATSLLTRWRHYGGVHRTVPRLRRLLREFSFVTARSALNLADNAAAVNASAQ